MAIRRAIDYYGGGKMAEESKKADVGKRFVALLIDCIISAIFSLVPFIGGIAGAIYMLIRDGLMKGASLGKKLLNLQVINQATGQPVSYEESIRRNLIFAIPVIFAIIPFFGWIISSLLSIIVYLLEGIAVLQDPSGIRMGDKFAKTQVVESSEAGVRQGPSQKA